MLDKGSSCPRKFVKMKNEGGALRREKLKVEHDEE